jgi:REP element-mobilizing transposase RayT
MDKPYQINDPEGIYFLTFVTVAWVDVFTRARYREILLDSLQYCQKEKGLLIYAWCLMSNHLHLIAGAKHKEPSLSDILRDLKKFTAKQILQSIQNQDEPESRREWMLWLFGSAGERNSRNTNFQFWQQENHAEYLYSPAFIKQKLDYVHNNPVKEQIVEKPEDYLYSSARNYVGMKGLLEVEYLL